ICHVKEIERAVSVEDHLAVAGCLNSDWLLGSSARCEVIGAVERCCTDGKIVRVFVSIVLVQTRMNEDVVARFPSRPCSGRPIRTGTGEVVSAQQSFKSRLL